MNRKLIYLIIISFRGLKSVFKDKLRVLIDKLAVLKNEELVLRNEALEIEKAGKR